MLERSESILERPPRVNGIITVKSLNCDGIRRVAVVGAGIIRPIKNNQTYGTNNKEAENLFYHLSEAFWGAARFLCP